MIKEVTSTSTTPELAEPTQVEPFLLEVADARPDDTSILPRLRNWFKEKLPNGDFSAILALAGDEVIASSGLVVHEHPPGIMIPNGREAYIMNMYTKPAWRGRGCSSYRSTLTCTTRRSPANRAPSSHTTLARRRRR